MNNRVFIGLAVAGIAAFLLVPGAGRSLGPLLLPAACPLSMMFMMRGMGSSSTAKGDTGASDNPPQPQPAGADELAALHARLAELEARNARAPRIN